MVLQNSSAGIQSDTGTFFVILPDTDSIGNGKMQMIILSFVTDADGGSWISIFYQIGVEIIQSPLQQMKCDLNLTGYRGKL